MLLSSGREEKTQVQCFRGKLITQVSSVWMYIYHVNRKVYKNKQTNKSNTTTTKNFKATNESLFKANMFTVYEICVNFQPFFFWRVKGSNNLEKLICSGYSCWKTIPCSSISTCSTELTMANGQQLKNTLFFFMYIFLLCRKTTLL